MISITDIQDPSLIKLQIKNGITMAKIVLIVGSVRRDRNGIKVARWMEKKLKDRGHDVTFVDPKWKILHRI
jgi:predicted CoA-binding protein